MMMSTHIRLARQSLKANRIRAVLTTLGILIGVASITLVLALGQGARDAVKLQVGSLEGNIILVKPSQSGFRDVSAYSPYNTAITSTLSEYDFRTISQTSGVGAAAPLMFIDGSVKFQDKTTTSAPIIATNEKLADILHLKLVSGDFISNATSRDTVVVGQDLALDLFGTDQAMGQEIIVKGRPHTVVGITKNRRQPINLAGVDLDRAVFTSLDNGKSFNQGIAQIQQVLVRGPDASHLPALSGTLRSALLANHNNEEDFSVLAGDDIVKSSDKFFGSIVLVTTIVSAITIVVSGIGIMNIMLAAVSERTREIGIRKAVGATDGQIVAQFLIEALAMSLAGGIAGILIAYGLAYVIGLQLFFTPAFSWQIILSSFGIALLTGVVFGLYPAVKAARKDPIEALRQYQ